MKAVECAGDCGRELTVFDDADERRCLSCANVGHGKHYQRKQARSVRADYNRERVVSNDRADGGSQ